MRQRDALAERGIKDGFVLIHLKLDTHRLQPNGVNFSHSVRPPRRQSGSLRLPGSIPVNDGGQSRPPPILHQLQGLMVKPAR